MKKYIITITLVLIHFISNSQRLFPGEKITELVSRDLINWKDDSINLQELKGKMILLDFWNHSCVSCIQGFYKLDSLQKKNRDKLQVILVCKESKDSTLKFFAKRKKISYYDLPLVTGAEKIWSTFNPGDSPCHAWIDTYGRFQYLTSSGNLNQKNIDEFLKGADLAFFNRALPGNYEKDESIINVTQSIYQSSLGPCDMKNIAVTRIAATVTPGTARTYLPCESIVSLYKRAYEKDLKGEELFSREHFVLNVRDSSEYLKPSDPSLRESWLQKHAYSYEQIIPEKDKKLVYEYLRDDLKRFFGLQVSIEKRTIPALYLIRKDKIPRIRTKGGVPVDEFRSSSLKVPIHDSIRQMKNVEFSDLVKKISQQLKYHNKISLVDKTGLSGRIDIEFREVSIDPFNLIEFKKDLNRYGLDIIAGQTLSNVLVLTETRDHVHR